MPNVCLQFTITLACLAVPSICAAGPPTTRPIEGLRQNVPTLHALTGARVVIAPGRVIDNGTIVIREGVIEQVGPHIDVPSDARVWKLEGRTIYPGFVDAYSGEKLRDTSLKAGAPYWNSHVQPQRSAARYVKVVADVNEKLRNQGITARLVVPKSGIIKGTSALLSTADGRVAELVLRADVALHMQLTTTPDWHSAAYPNSPMGAVALARQAMYDAQWYRKAWLAHRADHSLPQPERNDALEMLQDYVDSSRLIIVDANDEQFLLRADRFAREFALAIAIRGSGHEYRRLDAVRSTGRTVIVPVNFPKAPNVATPEAAANVTLEQLMHWDFAPENAARLENAGVPIALTSHGLEEVDTFLESVRKAVSRGLSRDGALRALTMAPARLFGVSDRLGSLEAGKIASLLVTDGDLFDDDTTILETWVQGKRYDVKKLPPLDLRGAWLLKLSEKDKPTNQILLELAGEHDELDGKISLFPTAGSEKKSAELRNVALGRERFTCVFDAETLGYKGYAQLSAIVADHSESNDRPFFFGDLIWPDGVRASFVAQRFSVDASKESVESSDSSAIGEEGEVNDESADSKSEVDPKASFAVNFPLGAFGRHDPPVQPSHVLFRGATIWTCGDLGVLENASVLVAHGKIQAIGRDLDVPPAALVVPADGMHITPGIVDCHSHMATDGGINESAQAITAEVRIGDFVDARHIAIYRQLAGGVTVANILHGSANPIGGQNQVIKLRWGALPEHLKFVEAPPGIKFALGENVKQSNWGDQHTTRYPQTRMGVEQIIRDAFRAAEEYRRRETEWRRTQRGLPPRVDLELQALVEILDGKRWIHCHAYRQDEMQALLRTLEDFGVTIGTFQHVLEGYKIADELVRHGAMGSAFSDWWAYKFEVYDAIPYNGALMFHAGVNVSFNSDSRELARHLNQEAAKAIKYGGVPAAEALKFVTLHPAQQLRIDEYVGSIETGKHADLALWNGPPLSNFSRCEQTWIDGRKYFDREEDLELQMEAQRKHAALVQKILVLKAPMLEVDEQSDDPSPVCPREDYFCHPH